MPKVTFEKLRTAVITLKSGWVLKRSGCISCENDGDRMILQCVFCEPIVYDIKDIEKIEWV